MRAIVLIDGGYFDNINRLARSEYSAGIDIQAFSTTLCGEFECELLRTKYYHSMPYIEEGTDDAEERRRRAQSFFDTIDAIENVQFEEKGRVRQVHADCPNCGTHFTHAKQKGVDVGIAVDLVEMSADRNSPAAYILVSGDEDMKHAVRAAKNNHANVFLGYGSETRYELYSSRALRREVDAQINVVEFVGDVLES